MAVLLPDCALPLFNYISFLHPLQHFQSVTRPGILAYLSQVSTVARYVGNLPQQVVVLLLRNQTWYDQSNWNVIPLL
jgi:hypothetical protein